MRAKVCQSARTKVRGRKAVLGARRAVWLASGPGAPGELPCTTGACEDTGRLSRTPVRAARLRHDSRVNTAPHEARLDPAAAQVAAEDEEESVELDDRHPCDVAPVRRVHHLVKDRDRG